MMKQRSRSSFGGLSGKLMISQDSYCPIFPPVHTTSPVRIESIPYYFLERQKQLVKKRTKDLIGVNPKRLLMSLRSDKHTESVWALNVLTIMLYDENINPINISPELLCLVMEHFYASLSLVFPKVFTLPEVKDYDDFPSTYSETDFWTEVIEKARNSGEELQMKVNLPIPRSINNNDPDFNSVTRTGAKIIVEEAEMPRRLRQWRPNSKGKRRRFERTLTIEERKKKGLPSEFASRLAAATKTAIEEQFWGRDELKYSIYSNDNKKHLEYDDDVQPKMPRTLQNNGDLKVFLYKILFIHTLFQMKFDREEQRKANSSIYDRDSPLDCSLIPRPIGFNLISQTIQDYAAICLAWSNVIRGFAFNPANESVLASNNELLKTISTLLMLYTEDEGESEKWDKLTVDKREMKSFLLDVANQLRDDAFTSLSVIAGSVR